MPRGMQKKGMIREQKMLYAAIQQFLEKGYERTTTAANHNHQLNWWFALALKGPYASSVSRRTEKVCQPHDFLRLRLKALFYYLLFLATRERVDIFFHTYLVICDVLLQLISDVLFYRFFVSSNCIYIISSTPEMSISIFIF